MGNILYMTYEQHKKADLLNHLVFLPEGYDGNPNKKWPVILFLHGIGERGNDLEILFKHGIPKVFKQKENNDFIAICPQCPNDTKWIYQTDALDILLDYALSTYRIDPDRVYLTGLSMGGHGTWKLAIEHPEKFAAIAPICGHKHLEGIENIKHIPVWLFHGAKDDVINIKESEEMAEALKTLGCDIRFTVYKDAKHDFWTETYNNPELYSWFLIHKKQSFNL